MAARTGELAADCVEMAQPLAKISEAFAALGSGRPESVLDPLRHVSPGDVTPAFAAMVDWLRVQALELQGYRSVDEADDCAARGVPIGGFATTPFSSRWRSGDLEELADGGNFDSGSESDHYEYLQSIWVGMASASFGTLEEARR